MTLTQLSIAAFLIETLLQTIKPLYDKEKRWHMDQMMAILIGILVCVGANIDVFAIVGLEMKIPYLGAVLTGIIASRGSNVMHDIIKYLQGLGNASDMTRQMPLG